MTWRAEALEERDWEYIAWKCFWQPWMKAPESIDDFNKPKYIERAEKDEAARQLAEEARKKMPKDLTPAEVRAAWNAFKLRNNL